MSGKEVVLYEDSDKKEEINEIYIKLSHLSKKMNQILIETAFDCNLKLFGGAVISLMNHEEPNDLDFAFSSYQQCTKFLDKINSFFTFKKIEETYQKGQSETYLAISKFIDDIIIKIDIVPESNLGVDQDFDVTSMEMTSLNSISIVKNQSSLNIFDVISNVKSKKFKLLKKFGQCPIRTSSTIVQSSKYVVEYLKFQMRIAKMLNKGWKCLDIGSNPNIIRSYEKLFNPLLIAINDRNSKCTICLNYPSQKYVSKVTCCKQQFCFSCIMNYVKERYNNTQIPCPLCRGDLFNFKTVN